MPNFQETDGIFLLERITKEAFKRQKVSNRIWCEQLKCWGFFSNSPNEIDRLGIIGCSKIGDMILHEGSIIWKPISNGHWEAHKSIIGTSSSIGVIFSKDVDVMNGVPIFKVSFLLGGEDAGVYDIIISQTEAYKIGWGLMGGF